MANPAAAHFQGWDGEGYGAFTERLARHAIKWLARYRLLSGELRLPGGKTVDDIVAGAVEAVVAGRRSWDPARHPDLEAFIKMVIVSEIRNLYKAKERWLVVPLALPEEEAADALEGAPRRSSNPGEEQLGGADPDPADILEATERQARVTVLLSHLRTEIETSVRSQQDRDDMGYILLALEEGYEGPAEIEEATSIPRTRIYKLLERMRALAARALRQIPES